MRADFHARCSGRDSRVFVCTLLLACGLFTSVGHASADEAIREYKSSKPDMVDQSLFDRAMDRLAERLRSHVAQTPAVPATQPGAPIEAKSDGSISQSLVRSIKNKMLRERDEILRSKRIALYRGQVLPSDVRALSRERDELQRLPADRLRSMLVDLQTKNTERHLRYHDSFGDLPSAGRTVVLILIKGGMIDSANALPDDPLTLDLDESRGVRRIYYQFDLPAHTVAASDNPAIAAAARRYNGFVEFTYNHESSLWVPTWADVNGEPMPLFDTAAFGPLRPFQIAFNGTAFVVTQEASHPIALLSLLGRRTDGPTFGSTFGSVFTSAASIR